MRISLVATVTSAFVFFVARYSELRWSLMRAERQLSISSHLAATALGRRVVREAALATGVAAVAGLPGALLPLLVGVLAAPESWVAILAALIVLGALGAYIGRAVAGSPRRWVSAMVLSGAAMSALGAALRIT